MGFLHAHLGETLAVSVAFMWAWGSLLFTIAGRRVGSTAVNFLRMWIAVVLLAGTLLVSSGRLWPAALDAPAHWWLAASGVIGLAIGDSFLFHGYTMIGPRRALLTYSTAPLFTAVTAWVLLGEKLGPLAILGMAMIIGGVWGATLGQDEGGGPFRSLPPAMRRRGLFDGLMAGTCQGLGATCAKLGMVSVAPLPATLVRMAWGSLALTLVLVAQRRATGLIGRFRDRRALLPLLGAVMLGPYLGVWASLAAFKHANTGVAMALMSTVPIMVLLPSWIVYRDKPSPTSLIGALVAVAGGALLFWR